MVAGPGKMVRSHRPAEALCGCAGQENLPVKIYVGNLSYEANEDALRDLFAKYGPVEEVAIITDRQTGKARGFGFVTMSDSAQGQAAIAALNGAQFENRALVVNEARPKAGGGGGGGGGGGYRDRR
jgi:cold-inducible RNA-binding protein